MLIAVVAYGLVYYFFFNKSENNNYNPQFQLENNSQTADWKTYRNTEGKFSFEYPVGWMLSRTDSLGVFFESNEGIIEVRYKGIYGIEYCDGKEEKFELNGQQLYSCHSVKNDDLESWIITYLNEDSKEIVTILAHVNKPYLSNRDIVLKILSTFKFTK